MIPVVILSTAGFHATTEVDRRSLTFGRTGDEDSLRLRGRHAVPQCVEENVGGDGLPDLVCHFETRKTGFGPGDTEGVLKGQTVGGASLTGSDSVHIVGG